MKQAVRLVHCVVKGCPWMGRNRYACPMHSRDATDAWDRQGDLLPDSYTKRHRRT